MRPNPTRALLLVLACGLCACDTEQPTLADGSETVAVGFTVTAVRRFAFDVWDEYQDVNQNGVLDAGDRLDGLFCDSTPQPLDPARVTEVPIPWAFGLRITVLRQGSQVYELLTPTTAAGYVNTPGGDGEVFYDQTPPTPDVPRVGILYDNPRRIPETSYLAIRECLQRALPNPDQIAGEPPPLEFALGRGDTVIIEAATDPTAPIPSLDGDRSEDAGTFTALILINGAAVEAGPDTTAAADGGALRFSYEVQ
jgi:hypothetical protein